MNHATLDQIIKPKMDFLMGPQAGESKNALPIKPTTARIDCHDDELLGRGLVNLADRRQVVLVKLNRKYKYNI